MGVYATDSAFAQSLIGVHLFHFFMSNCSQRVRFALEEKGVKWTSHHVNLPAREHLTADYREINPNAVVPTLVHDGTVILESNDIITYIDEVFAGPSFGPETDKEAAELRRLLDLSSESQSAVKVLSHELLFKPVRKVTAADVEAMEKEGARADLVAFMRDFSEDGDAWASRVDRAADQMRVALAHLDEQLSSDRPWLIGDRFGLADVSWSVNAFRLMQAQFETEKYPAFADWRARVVARPAFQSAVAQYSPA